jgi:PTS system galactitol-specific IIC component
MHAVAQVLQNLLNYGPSVFLPLIMFIIGLIIGMKPLPALGASILLGVAFQSVNLVIGFILNQIGPVGQDLVKQTGLHLTAFDLGWTPAAALSWAWIWAPLGFVIEIVTNIVMLSWRKTECLNVDMWNVWHLAWMGALVSFVTGSLWLALFWDIVWVVMFLKSADLTRRQVYKLTQIPGIAVSHPMLFTMIWQYPIYWVIKQIPGLKDVKTSPEAIRAKVGIFAENHVLGFIIGLLVALAARESAQTVLTTAIVSAAALTLFPVVSAFFMRALTPIADAAGEFMKRRYPGRMFYIGLDWPVLAGSATIWTVAIILVPFLLLGAILLPGNQVLPYGSIVFISGVVGAVILTQGDMLQSFLISLLSIPVYFYSATWVAPYMTRLAAVTHAVQIPTSVTAITWLNQDTPGVSWFMAEVPHMFQTGQWLWGIFALAVGVALYVWYYRAMLKVARDIDAESAPKPQAPAPTAPAVASND